QIRRGNGQCADALSRRGVDCIAKCRCDRRHARLTNAPRWGLALDNVHVGLRRDIHTRYQIISEVTLLNLPPANGYAALERIAQAHDGCSRNLGTYSIGIYGKTAIDGHIDARDRYPPIVGDRNM